MAFHRTCENCFDLANRLKTFASLSHNPMMGKKIPYYTLFFLLCVFYNNVFCEAKNLSMNSKETYVIRYFEGQKIIPVTVELDTEEQTERVVSLNPENGWKSVTIYDFLKKKMAYKDVDTSQCFVGELGDETLAKDRERLIQLNSGIVKGFYIPTFIIHREVTNPDEIIAEYGSHIFSFCNGSTVFFVTKEVLNSNRRSKRSTDNTNGNGQFTHHSYGHYGQQSNNYAHYGHETVIKGTVDKDGNIRNQRFSQHQVRSEGSQTHPTNGQGNGFQSQTINQRSTNRGPQQPILSPTPQRNGVSGLQGFGTGSNGQFSLQTNQESGYQLKLPLGLTAGNAYRSGIRSQGYYGGDGTQPQVHTDYQQYPVEPRADRSGTSDTRTGVDGFGTRTSQPAAQLPPSISTTAQRHGDGFARPSISQTGYLPGRIPSGIPTETERGVSGRFPESSRIHPPGYRTPTGVTIPAAHGLEGIQQPGGSSVLIPLDHRIPPGTSGLHTIPGGQSLIPTGSGTQHGLAPLEYPLISPGSGIQSRFTPPGYPSQGTGTQSRLTPGYPSLETGTQSRLTPPGYPSPGIGTIDTLIPPGYPSLETGTQSRLTSGYPSLETGTQSRFTPPGYPSPRTDPLGALTPPGYPSPESGSQIGIAPFGYPSPVTRTGEPGSSIQHRYGDDQIIGQRQPPYSQGTYPGIPSTEQGSIASGYKPGIYPLGPSVPVQPGATQTDQSSISRLSPSGVHGIYPPPGYPGSSEYGDKRLPGMVDSSTARRFYDNGSGATRSSLDGSQVYQRPSTSVDGSRTFPGYQLPTDPRVSPDYPLSIAPISSQISRESVRGQPGYVPRSGMPGSSVDPGDQRSLPVSTLTQPGSSRTGYSRGQPTGVISTRGGDTASSQTQIQTGSGGTAAEASAAGQFSGLGSQTQVQGGYSGNGSFSAQAQSGFTGGATQSQVQGGKQGGVSGSSAMVERVGSAQSQVQIGQPSGAASSTAQGRFSSGMTQVQAQSGRSGGSAGAESQSSGLSSSQVQVNIAGGEASPQNPFQGTVSASVLGGHSSGQSLTQLQGGYHSGRTYVATAQGGFDSNLGFQGPVPAVGSVSHIDLQRRTGSRDSQLLRPADSIRETGVRSQTDRNIPQSRTPDIPHVVSPPLTSVPAGTGITPSLHQTGRPVLGVPTGEYQPGLQPPIASRPGSTYSRYQPDSQSHTQLHPGYGQLPGHVSTRQFPGHLPTGLLPGHLPGGQLPSHLPGGQLLGHIPGRQLPGQVPSHLTGRQLPGHLSTGQFPGQVPSHLPGGQFPGRLPTGQLPGYLPTGQLPGHLPTGQLPGHLPTGQVPDQFPTGHLPSHFPTGHLPGHFPTGQLPGQLPEGQLPGQLPEGQLPGHSTTGQFHGQLPSRQLPGHLPGRQLPGHLPGGQLPGHLPEQLPGHLPIQPGHLPTGQLPDHLPTGQLPGQLPSRELPSHLPGGQLPGHLPTLQLPGQLPTLQLPGHLPTGQLPGQLFTGQLPGQLPSHFPSRQQPSRLPQEQFHHGLYPSSLEPESPDRGLIYGTHISPPTGLQQPEFPTGPILRPPSHISTGIPSSLPGQVEISPPRFGHPISPDTRQTGTLPIPSITSDHSSLRPTQRPGAPEPDLTQEGSCCQALMNLKKRCCGRQNGKAGSPCCSKANNEDKDFDFDEDFDDNTNGEPCKVVKAICYIVYKPVGKARICKPTNTNGC